MKISEAQKKILLTLLEPYQGNKPHPRDAFKENVLNVLEEKGLIVSTKYSLYLHGAVKLTEEGRKIAESFSA